MELGELFDLVGLSGSVLNTESDTTINCVDGSGTGCDGTTQKNAYYILDPTTSIGSNEYLVKYIANKYIDILFY